MSQVSPTDGDVHRSWMKQYLLGSAAPNEQEDLERGLLTDRTLLEQLEMAEEELIDEYLCDELSGEERARFDAHFLQAPERQERLVFARAFNRYLKTHPRVVSKPAARPAPARANPRTRPRMAAYAMAAMLLVTGGFAIRLMGKMNQLQRELSDARAQASRSSDLPPDAQLIREQRNTLASEVARLAENAPPASGQAAMLSVSLAPGRLRDSSPEATTSIDLSRGGLAIRATLLPGDNADDQYEARLRTASGRELLSWKALRATAKGREKAVVIDLPAVLLVSGNYNIELIGSSTAEKTETRQQFYFRVVKN
ncbi:MAG: hypothetical protein ACKVX9_01980 [Blastocatellia bacterium]